LVREMFNKTSQTEQGEQAVVIRSRGANIPADQIKAAFGLDVIIIDSNADVHNGLEYIGTFNAPPKMPTPPTAQGFNWLSVFGKKARQG